MVLQQEWIRQSHWELLAICMLVWVCIRLASSEGIDPGKVTPLHFLLASREKTDAYIKTSKTSQGDWLICFRCHVNSNFNTFRSLKLRKGRFERVTPRSLRTTTLQKVFLTIISVFNIVYHRSLTMILFFFCT